MKLYFFASSRFILLYCNRIAFGAKGKSDVLQNGFAVDSAIYAEKNVF